MFISGPRLLAHTSFILLLSSIYAKPITFNYDDPEIKSRVDKITTVVCSDNSNLPVNKANQTVECFKPSAQVDAVFAKCRQSNHVASLNMVCHILKHGRNEPSSGPGGSGGPGGDKFHQCMQEQYQQAPDATKKAIDDFRSYRSSIEGQKDLLSCMEKAIA